MMMMTMVLMMMMMIETRAPEKRCTCSLHFFAHLFANVAVVAVGAHVEFVEKEAEFLGQHFPTYGHSGFSLLAVVGRQRGRGEEQHLAGGVSHNGDRGTEDNRDELR